jgi:hypothetical protein
MSHWSPAILKLLMSPILGIFGVPTFHDNVLYVDHFQFVECSDCSGEPVLGTCLEFFLNCVFVTYSFHYFFRLILIELALATESPK